MTIANKLKTSQIDDNSTTYWDESKGVYYPKVDCVDHGDSSEVGSIAWLCNTYIHGLGDPDSQLELIPGNYAIGTSFIIPINISLNINNGALLTIASGEYIVIYASVKAGLYQIFSHNNSDGVQFGTSAMTEIYPEWFGAGSADDSIPLQATIYAAGAVGTYKPRIRFQAKTYTYSTSLTISERGIALLGNGAIYVNSPSGFYADVTILYYTGSAYAMLVDTGMGFTMEKIYLKGTSSATNGLYLTQAGAVLRDCVFGQFSKVNAAGCILASTQCNSFYSCSFIDNYYGSYLTNSTLTNTVNTFYSCVWHSNTQAGHFERRAQGTLILNGTFQGTVGQGGSAVIIDCTHVGSEDSANFRMIGGYISGCNAGTVGYEISVTGHDTGTAEYYPSLILKDIFWASSGAASLGHIYLKNTRRAVLDNVVFQAIPPIIVAPVVGVDANLDLSILSWNQSWADTCITDGAGNTVHWPKLGPIQPYGYQFRGDAFEFLQTNISSSRQVIKLSQASTARSFIDFAGTEHASANYSISSWIMGGAIKGMIQVEINGAVAWMPYYYEPLGTSVTSTTAALDDKTNAINTTGKTIGKRVWNTNTNLFVTATGTADTDTWINDGGVTAHTPT